MFTGSLETSAQALNLPRCWAAVELLPLVHAVSYKIWVLEDSA